MTTFHPQTSFEATLLWKWHQWWEFYLALTNSWANIKHALTVMSPGVDLTPLEANGKLSKMQQLTLAFFAKLQFEWRFHESLCVGKKQWKKFVTKWKMNGCLPIERQELFLRFQSHIIGHTDDINNIGLWKTHWHVECNGVVIHWMEWKAPIMMSLGIQWLGVWALLFGNGRPQMMWVINIFGECLGHQT